jgi:hypothetical protein
MGDHVLLQHFEETRWPVRCQQCRRRPFVHLSYLEAHARAVHRDVALASLVVQMHQQFLLDDHAEELTKAINYYKEFSLNVLLHSVLN